MSLARIGRDQPGFVSTPYPSNRSSARHHTDQLSRDNFLPQSPNPTTPNHGNEIGLAGVCPARNIITSALAYDTARQSNLCETRPRMCRPPLERLRGTDPATDRDRDPQRPPSRMARPRSIGRMPGMQADSTPSLDVQLRSNPELTVRWKLRTRRANQQPPFHDGSRRRENRKRRHGRSPEKDRDKKVRKKADDMLSVFVLPQRVEVVQVLVNFISSPFLFFFLPEARRKVGCRPHRRCFAASSCIFFPSR